MEPTAYEPFIAADPAHVRKERTKARELRKSAWWKRKLAEGICYFCEGKFKPEELTMDHLVPVIRGGFSVKQNLVTSCKACNSKKKYLTPVELRNSPSENCF